MTRREIENYINTYRTYPEAYTGERDPQPIYDMEHSYKLNRKTLTVTQYLGEINAEGNFVLIGLFNFPLGKPEERVPTYGLNMKQVTDYYNTLVTEAGFPEKTIGTEYSKETADWNLRDMVAEMDHVRSTFYEPGHPNNKWRDDDPAEWETFLNRIYYFLSKYRQCIGDLVAHTKHNSKYDN